MGSRVICKKINVRWPEHIMSIKNYVSRGSNNLKFNSNFKLENVMKTNIFTYLQSYVYFFWCLVFVEALWTLEHIASLD